jgi:hypothetical protein
VYYILAGAIVVPDRKCPTISRAVFLGIVFFGYKTYKDYNLSI